MLFCSLAFMVFLPTVFFLYWFVFNRSLVYQNALLLFSSYVFYGWWNWKFLGLLLLSTILDYSFGFLVAKGPHARKKLFLGLSILNNLLVLGIFKYYDFFALETQHLLGRFGIQLSPLFLHLVLPVGISFYTFHGMSYVFDIYYGRIRPVRRLVDYAVFVSFFPLLVAGPIERAAHLLPQIQQPRRFDYNQAVQGLRLMLWGFIKKLVVADTLARAVDDVFANYTHYSGSTLVMGIVLFSFQIYADFSGYTDIALGVARLFGFELLSNFKFPYFSRDVAEFWRRWHISLSSWFRDYVYIPLGGSKAGKGKAIRNTVIVFVISGFWHGANLTYLTWGCIHALGFMPLLLLGKNRRYTGSIVAQQRRCPTLREAGAMLATFAFVTLAWVFFRANTIHTAIDYLWNMRKGLLTDPNHKFEFLCYVLPFLAIDWHFRRNERELRLPSARVVRYGLYIIGAGLIVYHSGNITPFLYFQF
jgi:alginate O-acetyltransferase complex protein AlgI